MVEERRVGKESVVACGASAGGALEERRDQVEAKVVL